MAGKNFMNSIQTDVPKRSSFDLSHAHMTSCNMGNLIPVATIRTMPGDSFALSTEGLHKFAPMIAPPMWRYDVYFHWFFTPDRILWPNFSKWITNTPNPTVLPAFPYFNINAPNPGSYPLLNYLGLPKSSVPAGTYEKVSAMPFAAYLAIYNEYYRDQNLEPELDYQLGDGDNTPAYIRFYDLRRRAWERDYFTSCLPEAQKGEAVEMPMGSVELKDPWYDALSPNPKFVKVDGSSATTGNVAMSGDDITSGAAGPVAYDPSDTLTTSPTTINDFRRANALQKLLEKLMRGGSRLKEYYKHVYNVNISDKTLQRPEYITGCKAPLIISEVLNTTGTVDAPQGNMSGHGAAFVQGKYGNFYAEDHGYLMCIMSIMPKTGYSQGIPRHFSEINDPFDLPTPDMANIGEQEVKNKEIYAFQGVNSEGTFGYQARWGHYKTEPNRVSGEFVDSLDFWVHNRQFASAPALNKEFIECDPDFRIFAVEDPNAHHIYNQIYHKIRVKRSLPFFGTPNIY